MSKNLFSTSQSRQTCNCNCNCDLSSDRRLHRPLLLYGPWLRAFVYAPISAQLLRALKVQYGTWAGSSYAAEKDCHADAAGVRIHSLGLHFDRGSAVPSCARAFADYGPNGQRCSDSGRFGRQVRLQQPHQLHEAYAAHRAVLFTQQFVKIVWECLATKWPTERTPF